MPMGTKDQGTSTTVWTTPEAGVPIDLAAARTAVKVMGRRASQLIRSIPDMGAEVPGSEWTVGDFASHLVIVFRGFTDAVEGRLDYWDERYGRDDLGTWARLAAGNARTVQDVSDRHDRDAVARQLDEGVRAFLAATASRSPDYTFRTPWYGRDRTRVLGNMTCLVLGELVLHGYDIATALGRPWPIDPAHARLIISGVFTVMLPLVANPQASRGVNAVYEIRVTGGPRFLVGFDDGAATVEPAGTRPVDCHLVADPVTWLLVGYGRISQWGPITRGKLRAWGRKPWLGPRFKSLLHNP